MSVSDDWLTFEGFRDDMHASYLEACETYGEKNVSIDRINNMEGYRKENCRWTTPKQQARNTRRNVFLTHKGETKTIAEWGETSGVNEKCLQLRISRYGWDVQTALETPVKENGGRFKKGHPCYKPPIPQPREKSGHFKKFS